MRIIAGKLKNKKIEFICEEKTRPTADIVRQALFTKLQFEFSMENCLDLFGGSGSLGLEALSRDAKHIYFVENNRTNVKVIENNLKNCGIEYDIGNYKTERSASLIISDYLLALNKFEIQFNLILIDPPYASDYYEKALNVILQRDLLADDGYIVLEHNEDRKFENLPFNIVSEKKYGKRCLTYLQK